MTFLLLFYEFFKTGLFAIGGGMATLPFLAEIAEKYTWFDANRLSDMIAISESTPGPIGINMATYAGYSAGLSEGGILMGILGATTAVTALVLPSLIIIIIVANFLKKFKENPLVEDVFYVLRPAVTALIAVAGFGIVQSALVNTAAWQAGANITEILNFLAIGLFLLILIAQNIWKKIHPIVYIAAAAVIGIVFQL
ncbi:MAG: chromate transporter [Oscillospiraceae bacterium]